MLEVFMFQYFTKKFQHYVNPKLPQAQKTVRLGSIIGTYVSDKLNKVSRSLLHVQQMEKT